MTALIITKNNNKRNPNLLLHIYIDSYANFIIPNVFVFQAFFLVNPSFSECFQSSRNHSHRVLLLRWVTTKLQNLAALQWQRKKGESHVLFFFGDISGINFHQSVHSQFFSNEKTTVKPVHPPPPTANPTASTSPSVDAATKLLGYGDQFPAHLLEEKIIEVRYKEKARKVSFTFVG